MIRLLDIALADNLLERVRRNFFEAIAELQRLPFVGARVIEDVVLKDGQETPIPHRLGRPAAWVRESCVRNGVSNGRVEEVRSGAYKRDQYVVLKATGFGADVTVDVVVL